MSRIVIKIDAQLKKDAEVLFNDLGMDMKNAVTVFIKKSLRERRIPFDVSMDTHQATTRVAGDEAGKSVTSQGIPASPSSQVSPAVLPNLPDYDNIHAGEEMSDRKNEDSSIDQRP